MITEQELVTIRNNHYQADYASLHGDGVTLDVHLCASDGREWPCMVVRLLDEIDRLRAENRVYRQAWLTGEDDRGYCTDDDAACTNLLHRPTRTVSSS